jgi:hypothetical protein
MGGRVPSESDLSSNISDDVLVTPGNKMNGLPIQSSSSLVSTDNEVLIWQSIVTSVYDAKRKGY